MGYDSQVLEFHRYTPGVPQAAEWDAVLQDYMDFTAGMEKDPTKHSTGPNRHLVDRVWIVCLERAGIIARADAGRLLRAIRGIQSGAVKVGTSLSHGFAERQLIEALAGDEDLASVVNLGRTLQEPMSRLDLRDTAIDTFGTLLRLRSAVLEVAEAHVDTIMPGHTHLSQAQPITYSHYLLSVAEGLDRATAQLELAYEHVNRNSGGCGATSGITLPIDRTLMSELLGMAGVVEPTYDSESSQDHSLSLLQALTNIVLLLSKSSMDLNIWTMEEFGTLRVDPAWCGVSSMMPQKCIGGTLLERTRIEASYVVGQMVQACLLTKGEPHADMLPMLELPKLALHAMARTTVAMRYYQGIVQHSEPRPEVMLEYVCRGYSCSSEVAMHLVVHGGYGTRRAHRVVATFVRLARERGLAAYDVEAALLDEAARFAGEREPGLTTSQLRALLDPARFIASHDQPGGTARDRQVEMIEAGRAKIAAAWERQTTREASLRSAHDALQQAEEALLEA